MSKELEALETLKDMLIGNGCNNSINDYVDNLILPIKQALQRLETMDNSNPSEALECLEKLELLTCDFEWYKDNINTIKQALIKAQDNEKKLDRVEKLTYLLFKDRRKIGQEYIKFCENNNVVYDDATNMVTWALFKLKEVLENE